MYLYGKKILLTFFQIDSHNNEKCTKPKPSCILTNKHTHTHTHKHAHAHTHIHTQTYTHTHSLLCPFRFLISFVLFGHVSPFPSHAWTHMHVNKKTLYEGRDEVMWGWAWDRGWDRRWGCASLRHVAPPHKQKQVFRAATRKPQGKPWESPMAWHRVGSTSNSWSGCIRWEGIASETSCVRFFMS